MSRPRNRPPKLEPRVGTSQPAPLPTLPEILDRSKVTGTSASGPGPTELRRTIERLATADRRAFGQVVPITGLTRDTAWAPVIEVFGATRRPRRDRRLPHDRGGPFRGRAVREVAGNGARVAIATASPASLLTLHLAFARLVRERDGDLVELADVGPIRADGRTPRWLRWIGGVAVVSDGHALCAARGDGEAAREWMFAIPRPALVVADGPFAEVAWEQGVEVVAVAGLDHPALAIVGARAGRCTLVPMHTDRPARAYRPIEELVVRDDVDSVAGTDRGGGGVDADLAGQPVPEASPPPEARLR